MAHISAKNLIVDFPIYGAASRSLKNTVLHSATGGSLAKDSADKVVVRALNGLSFEIGEGDRIGLLGHNGSGKSTLLRVLAGGYEPISGTLDMEGSVASMLSISLGMEGEANGYENIVMMCTLMGLGPKEIDKLMPEITEFTELGEFLSMPLRTYSSGMHMRVPFAVATAVKADIVLMDEWLSVGDEAFSKKAQARLQEMLDSAKILVLASHDRKLLESNCNRLFHLEHGHLVEIENL
ncbi:MAG: ATP-binding cassette domain-containing protein [Sideroxydans sp.]|nr:ATP-binding cassette domain-containing protein [Sideroxydans sp.]